VRRSELSRAARTRAGIVSAVVAGCLAGGALAAATASAGTTAAVTGTVLGGQTSQGWPIVVELGKSGRQVTTMSAGMHLTCTSGDVVNLPDGYKKLTVSSSGKFGTSFGPMTQRMDDGTTVDFEGNLTGKLNKARTKASGKWQFKATNHDTAGAVTDTCDSGSVSWSAKA
jgi:hypothetical protein